MPITTPPSNYIVTNNPSKEILASSGIYNGQVYAATPYAIDLPDVEIANTGINVTSTTTSTTPSPISHGLLDSDLSYANYVIDDLLVFNNYIHYDTKGTLKTFNPEFFLQQSIVTFNIYSLEYR